MKVTFYSHACFGIEINKKQALVTFKKENKELVLLNIGETITL